MAQIIKHRRGSLESIQGATKRAGELLVVTGSSGITAANGNSILFMGVDGSTVTPANKVLQGTTVPDLTGASYDTSIDGIPYYDTNAQKLYILNKGGNVEVKATANTGGTGIVSGSSQVISLLPTGTVSGSSQVVSILSSLNSYTSSNDTNITELFASASNHEGRIDLLESFSSSLEGGFVNNAELASATGALETADSAIEGRLDNIEGFTSSIDTTIKTKLNADAVVSSSAQIVSLLENQATDFGTGRLSADSIGNADGSSTITGSFVGDGSGITGLSTTIKVSGSDGSNDSVSLLDGALSFAGGTAVSTSVATDTVTISVQDASTSAKGIASFSSTNFGASTGNITIKSGGVPAVALASDVAGTGLSLDGVDNSLEVDYGSTAGTSVEGNTSLTVQGTANEISVSGGSVTLGAGGTVTIGLPDEVTIATASVDGDLSVGGNVEITGNLSVLGTTTTIDSTTIQIGDNVLELNYGGAQATAGLLVTDATAPNTVSGSLLWDGTNDYWKAGILGSEKEIARLNATPTSGSVQVIGANGLLVDSTLSDDGTDATFSGDVIVTGLTANTFLVSDGSKTLTSVAPANAGDLIQWNGSSFVASNTIDGGTF